ncbi:MAG: carbohydrate ABC transporter permease [Anaerolineae bacterium]
MLEFVSELAQSHPKVYTLIWSAATVVFIVLASLATGALARWIARLRGKNQMYQQRTFGGYLFASPWIVGYLIFVIGPTLFSLYWSFTRYRLPEPPQWVGLENYIKLLTADGKFRVSLLNSLYMTVLGLPLQMVTALTVAMMLYQKLHGERIFRIIYYLPVMLATSSAMLITWRLVLNPNNGMLNAIIRGVGDTLPPFEWLTRAVVHFVELSSAAFLGLQKGDYTLLRNIQERGFPAPGAVPLWHQNLLWSKPALILIGIWSSGAMMLIYLAALYGVPSELLEAARVDGANSWQRFRHIILPLISPATFYNLVVGVIATLQIFEQSYVLTTNGGPAQSTYFVAYYLWRSTFRFNKIGYGAAMSWILLAIVLALTLINFRLSERWVYYG